MHDILPRKTHLNAKEGSTEIVASNKITDTKRSKDTTFSPCLVPKYCLFAAFRILLLLEAIISVDPRGVSSGHNKVWFVTELPRHFVCYVSC